MSVPRSKILYYLPWALLIAVIIVCFATRKHWFGGKPAPIAQTTAAPADLRALAQNTALADKGKQLFKLHCASCHGPNGNGDGERAKGLNPPPRNYHTEAFKYGSDVASLYNTLLKGSPGTSMTAFAQLPPEELFALVHFVRTQIPNPAPTTDAVLALLPSVPSAASVAALDLGPRISIKLAMERLAKPAPLAMAASNLNRDLPGAILYERLCSRCHGAFGEGGAQRVLAVAPYRYQRTASLAAFDVATVFDRGRFAEIVLKGLPGRSMPGFGTLTSKQVEELYIFTKSMQTDK